MTVTAPLTRQELERLRDITSPTICNAIETFNLRPRSAGFVGPEIKCMYPQWPPMVGYAATAIIGARLPAGEKPRATMADLWQHVLSIPEPRVVVVQDIDYPRPIGSFWGEVNANMYKALGCVGTVTDGGVRDMDEVEALGFHFFASTILVSHAYIHVVDVGVPIEIGGLVVNPGDLLHGDKHGITTIPLEVAKEAPEAVKKVEEQERRVISLCQQPNMTPEKFVEVMSQRMGRRH